MAFAIQLIFRAILEPNGDVAVNGVCCYTLSMGRSPALIILRAVNYVLDLKNVRF